VEKVLISPIIVALDLDYEDSLEFAKKIDPQNCRLKVGSQLFTQKGPRIIEELSALGFDIFLDLKFHDIPNTVASAVEVASELGVWMLNVHTSGGSKMMQAARLAANKSDKPPLVIGVTILTSLNQVDMNELGVKSISNQINNLASLAYKSSLDGIVCSAGDVKNIKSLLGGDFLTITPGIRAIGAPKDDQSRVSSAKQAIEDGSDYLVIGRPITQSPDPLKSLEMFLKEIN
jgi:orotidine-5'-phosphate decarboxylase